MKQLTLAVARELGACQQKYNAVFSALGPKYGDHTIIPLSKALEITDVQSVFWYLCKEISLSPEQWKDLQYFAIWCAESSLAVYEKKCPEDNRPREAIEAAKKYLNGEITKGELEAAAGAARAAWAATEAAAWAAAWAAAEAARAAWAATEAAAWAATEAAAWAAAEAARAAWAATEAAAWAATEAAAWAAAEAAAWAARAAWAATEAAAWAATRAAQKEELMKIFIKWESV